MLSYTNIAEYIRGLSGRFHMLLRRARTTSSIFRHYFVQNKTSTARMTPDHKQTMANCGSIPVLPEVTLVVLKFLNAAMTEYTQPSGHAVRERTKRVDPRSSFPVIDKPHVREC